MTLIDQEDVVDSIAAALQSISHHHPPDFVRALKRAHAAEVHAPARSAMEQLLINSKLAATGRRPLCQDTGIAQIFFRLGVEVSLKRRDSAPIRGLQALSDEAVRRAYRDPVNPLRATMIYDPLGRRLNTQDNTPAQVHVMLVEGGELEVLVVAKGGGGDVKARFATLNPSDSVADWVLEQLPGMGAGWCPPGLLGIGIGGSPEQAMLLAKLALFEPIDIDLLRSSGPGDAGEALRLELFDRVNALGIGAQGLGGLSTVLDVKVATAPCHAASMPVALIPNCAATRYTRIRLDGNGPAQIEEPTLDLWDGIADSYRPPHARKVDVDRLDRAEVASWRTGETLLLSGKVLTARDAAHKCLVELLSRGEPLPVDLTERVIYYVGPVEAVAGEAVGPAGPTTANRMDKFVEPLLAKTGLLAMIGKAERGPEAIDSICRHRAAYLVAVGGAAYLLSKAIRKSRVVAFPELAMEAIHEFELLDFPVTVAVDVHGVALHRVFTLQPSSSGVAQVSPVRDASQNPHAARP
ncbi:fumarate hydratase [Hydrogenophaga sp.]|uniref:fumarate hydratase n=1 Tax=Hydrogenophaga sp. TaxID=1904254 RepID=UPI002FC58630